MRGDDQQEAGVLCQGLLWILNSKVGVVNDEIKRDENRVIILWIKEGEEEKSE